MWPFDAIATSGSDWTWRATASAMPPRYDSPEHWDAARAQEDLDFHLKHGGVGGPMPEERKPGRKGKLSFVDKEQIDFIRFGRCKRAEARAANGWTIRKNAWAWENGNSILRWDVQEGRRRNRVVERVRRPSLGLERNEACASPPVRHGASC